MEDENFDRLSTALAKLKRPLTLEGYLGEGGWSVVYKAHRDEQPVAVKLAIPNSVSESSLSFKNEMFLQQRLASVNTGVANVYDYYINFDGLSFGIMELASYSLCDILYEPDELPSQKDCIDFMIRLVQIMEKIHETRGIIQTEGIFQAQR